MSTKSRLDKLYKNAPRIRLPEDPKILFIADTHMGDGGPEDDFKKNEKLFCKIMKEYYEQGFWLILLGDIIDLWECPDRMKIMYAHPESHGWLAKFEDDKRRKEVGGNHDNSLNYPEAIVLQIGDLEIFCNHGNPGDWFNDGKVGMWISKNFVRYIWVPLQWLGWHDPMLAKRKKHEAQEKRLQEWSIGQAIQSDKKRLSMFGHTHLLKNTIRYRNAGSWVGNGGEGIVFEDGKFTEKHF